MRILCFSSLFPNPSAPSLGGFVLTRLRHLVADTGIEAQVVAPVAVRPWARSTVPAQEERSGLRVHHPAFAALPGAGLWINPWAMAAAALPVIRRLQQEGFEPDLIDAHYFYPDGVAASLVARRLGKPLVITARGTDLYHFPKYWWPRRLIHQAAAQAAGLICVSRGLQQQAARAGLDPARFTVLRNGVDLQRFMMHDRAMARQDLIATKLQGFDPAKPLLASVGNLLPLKSHDLVIHAMVALPQAQLLIAGQGPERDKLQALIDALQLGNRVRLVGQLTQPELNRAFSASDVSVLASSREGWANVLLESMASGTPVVASRIEGTDEVVRAPEAGLLVERTPEAIAQGISTLLTAAINPERVRAYAEQHDWRPVSLAQQALFEKILARGRS